MEHIGIDVHKNQSQICILTNEGELIEKRIVTERGRFAGVFGSRARARILIEASTESEWVARCLEALGHEVVVGDPNYSPMYGRRTRRVKTDRRDARALAEACRSGTYRPAHRTSDARRHLRGRLAVREALVRTRARYISLIRALLRREGLRVRKRSGNGVLDNPIEVRSPRIIGEAFFPEPRRERGNVAGGMIFHALQHVDQVGVRIDPLQPAGGQQTVEDPDVLGPDLGPAEQPILSSECNRANFAFQVIRVDRHVGVFEKHL
jgi:hypothetical protein